MAVPGTTDTGSAVSAGTAAAFSDVGDHDVQCRKEEPERAQYLSACRNRMLAVLRYAYGLSYSAATPLMPSPQYWPKPDGTVVLVVTEYRNLHKPWPESVRRCDAC